MAETSPPAIGRGSETAKNAAARAVQLMGYTGMAGEKTAQMAGLRVVDARLNTRVAGIDFENPVMVGAGEDETGALVNGFHILGFAGVEVGTVVPLSQAGNPRPRLFTHPQGVALNRMGFNSPGVDAVEAILARHKHRGVVGINAGKNKWTQPAETAEEHALVIRTLQTYGDYFVVNLATPNTPDARDILRSHWLGDIIAASKEAAGGKPLFVKTTVDLTLPELDAVLATGLEFGIAGVIDTNTTVDSAIKARYGWQGQPGGVSGNDPDYRRRATERMRHITHETAGTGLCRIGVGAINDAASAIERLKAGAQIVQVVTGNRQRKGLAAPIINKGILKELEKRGMDSVEQFVGTAI